jgi:hypothetical protein
LGTNLSSPRDPRDGRHAKIHQNLGDVPCHSRQPPDLDDMFCLSLLEEFLELDKLHKLFMIVPGIESLGLPLR